MKYFVINRARLITILDYDVRKSPRGVINWMVDDKNMLVIFLHIQGVNYVYREFFEKQEDVPVEIRSMLHKDGGILGVLEIKETGKKESPKIEPPKMVFNSLQDGWATGFLQHNGN